MVGRTPRDVTTCRPLREGVFADFRVAEEMIRAFIGRVRHGLAFFNPKVVVGVPSGATAVERMAIPVSFLCAAARQVDLMGLLRATTVSDETLDRSVSMYSLIPSEKYSCSGSPLMLANGKTQMLARCVARAGVGSGAAPGWPPPLTRSAIEPATFQPAASISPLQPVRSAHWMPVERHWQGRAPSNTELDELAVGARAVSFRLDPLRFHRVVRPDHHGPPWPTSAAPR